MFILAIIKPFKALRFTDKAGEKKELCCPPYDIINDLQREEYIKTNQYNVIRLELPKGLNPYQVAAQTLSEWYNNSIVSCDKKDSIYIYEESFQIKDKKYSFRGFVSRVQLEEFSKGIILPHEQTLSKAKDDRLNLMKATSCNFSQIYSLYIDKNGDTPKLLNRMTTGSPDSEFCDSDNVTHRLWICDNENLIKELCEQFKDRKLYIADGHHRYETGLNYRNYCRENNLVNNGDCDYIMMMCVDMQNDGLVVFPTHRIVRDLANFDSSNLINNCEKFFDVEKLDSLSCVQKALETKYEQGKKSFGYFDGQIYRLLTLKSDVSNIEDLKDIKASLRQLDVTVLHTLILENLLGIDKENMANQINLTYTRDSSEAINSVNSGKANCCFILNPTRITEIADVAEDGEKMPQKSTYFYPKLITGLVMNKID